MNLKKSDSKQLLILDPKKREFLLWDMGKMRDWKREEVYIFPDDADKYLRDAEALATELIEDPQLRRYVLHNLYMFYGRDFLEINRYNFKRKNELRMFIENDVRDALPMKDAHFSDEHKQVCYGCKTLKYE